MAWKVKAHFGLFRSLDVTPQLVSAHGELNYDPDKFDWSLFAQNPTRYLSVTNESLRYWRPLLVAPQCRFSLAKPVDVVLSEIRTRIVYFINCYVNANYLHMVSSQLKELRETGLLTETHGELHVVSSGTAIHRESLAVELRKWFGAGTSVFHEHTKANQFEYPGINKVWQLGQQAEDAYILYFHARGLSRMKLGRYRRNRQPQEKRLFGKVIGEWRQNLTWLQHVTSADKLGLTCGGNGWIWFNFWWTRATYVRHLEKPEVTDRRHYYEDWLGRYRPPRKAHGQYASNLSQCLATAAAPSFQKYNLGSDFHPLRGETHLGLPWGWAKALVTKLLHRNRF
jgi:hypothetical protein